MEGRHRTKGAKGWVSKVGIQKERNIAYIRNRKLKGLQVSHLIRDLGQEANFPLVQTCFFMFLLSRHFKKNLHPTQSVTIFDDLLTPTKSSVICTKGFLGLFPLKNGLASFQMLNAAGWAESGRMQHLPGWGGVCKS